MKLPGLLGLIGPFMALTDAFVVPNHNHGLQRPTIRRHAPSRTLRMQDEAVAEPPAPPPSAVAPTAPPVTFSSLEELLTLLNDAGQKSGTISQLTGMEKFFVMSGGKKEEYFARGNVKACIFYKVDVDESEIGYRPVFFVMDEGMEGDIDDLTPAELQLYNEWMAPVQSMQMAAEAKKRRLEGSKYSYPEDKDADRAGEVEIERWVERGLRDEWESFGLSAAGWWDEKSLETFSKHVLEGAEASQLQSWWENYDTTTMADAKRLRQQELYGRMKYFADEWGLPDPGMPGPDERPVEAMFKLYKQKLAQVVSDYTAKLETVVKQTDQDVDTYLDRVTTLQKQMKVQIKKIPLAPFFENVEETPEMKAAKEEVDAEFRAVLQGIQADQYKVPITVSTVEKMAFPAKASSESE
ncbi:unnamed protein product [Vitrella brassicaformis CCMP3155]|uniref:Uncharacterized protein n=2 Tax=Vitrella brassicaformis TaxID=1169539 RepID=A0A0G4EMS6_VITBC|nr:unnamed protein product [Vitrella brassicaformis CCMP3155]|eukprot:CEL98317.1 unnamed protein product [Vitrella brassicaformis CCMP3155]